MSLDSWKREFYPVPADAVSADKALAHSIQKWEGLRPENLAKHGVNQAGMRVVSDESVFFITAATCALCHHYDDGAEDDDYCHCCSRCPLALARDGVLCDEERDGELDSPYHVGVSSTKPTPEPMLMWLKKAQEA